MLLAKSFVLLIIKGNDIAICKLFKCWVAPQIRFI